VVSVLEPGGKHYGMSSASRRAPAREAQATSKADSLVARSTTNATLWGAGALPASATWSFRQLGIWIEARKHAV